jgi:hypothetical protein
MSKASEEFDFVVETMQMGVLKKVFTQSEVEAMLVDAFNTMTVGQMDDLLHEHTSYPNMMELYGEVASWGLQQKKSESDFLKKSD